MEILTGYVGHIVFQNAENGYTVLELVCGEDEITCVGIFHGVSEGESLELSGEYTTHPSYGKQFKMASFQVKPPEDIVSIERYLGSGAIKGIGAALAARIVRKFREDTFRIIEEDGGHRPSRGKRDQPAQSDGDCRADGRQAGITPGNGVLTAIWHFPNTGGKNI